MRLLGIILGGDCTGAASAMYEAGVTAKAELKSQVGVAAEVERVKDQLQFVDIRVLVYTAVYNSTLPSPTGFWRFLTEF